jgi:hypothetical protein
MLNFTLKSECARVLVWRVRKASGRVNVRLATPVRARTFFMDLAFCQPKEGYHDGYPSYPVDWSLP